MVLLPTPAFALRPPEAAQSKETITGLEEALGAAKHKGILPIQELIRAIKADSSRTDLSASPWLKSQLEVESLIKESEPGWKSHQLMGTLIKAKERGETGGQILQSNIDV